MPTPNDAKEVFRRCGTCSQTFAFLIDRAYGHHDPLYEKALDPLAGGIFREGHQCGMLWGAALATGAEAFSRADSIHEAQAMALSAAKELVASMTNKEHTIECREITGVRMNRFWGLLRFMMETIWKGMDNSKCFVLAEEWAPKAMASAEAGLNEDIPEEPPGYNCASITVLQLGGTDQEVAMVAGFAGGIGLSGKGCGALGAAIWFKALQWLRENPGKGVPMFRFPEVSNLIEGFKKQAHGKMRCEEICVKKFGNAKELSDYLESGGCSTLISWLTSN